MTAKKSRLCWDDIDDLDSRTLAEWGTFRSHHVETVELNGHHMESATFMMAPTGFSFELTYLREDEGDATAVTVRERIQLYRSPRRASRERQVMGYEVMFLCPTCGRRAKRLALLRHGAECAKCCEIKWGSERESKIARLVRRIDGRLQAHWSWRTGTKYRERSPRACELCAICASFNVGSVC